MTNFQTKHIKIVNLYLFSSWTNRKNLGPQQNLHIEHTINYYKALSFLSISLGAGGQNSLGQQNTTQLSITARDPGVLVFI